MIVTVFGLVNQYSAVQSVKRRQSIRIIGQVTEHETHQSIMASEAIPTCIKTPVDVDMETIDAMDLRIENDRLRRQVNMQQEEIVELRSQVHKYKSVLDRCNGYLAPNNYTDSPLKPRKNRLLGISSEPQSNLSYDELIQTNFTYHAKSEK